MLLNIFELLPILFLLTTASAAVVATFFRARRRVSTIRRRRYPPAMPKPETDRWRPYRPSRMAAV